jgi:hypothetical protein
MMTSEVSSDKHLQAILPRISRPTIHEQLQTGTHVVAAATTAVPAASSMDNMAIEEHVSFIAFDKNKLLLATGWEPKPLDAVPGLVYVRLDGEQITVAPLPAARPRAVASATSDKRPGRVSSTYVEELLLPHLRGNCCSAMQKLSGDYLPPTYRGAAAVFDLPAGKAAACRANTRGVNSNRIDTRVTIENDGVLVISYGTGARRKELLLAGDTEVMAANIPADFVLGSQSTGFVGTAHHYLAYYRMGAQANGCNKFECATSRTADIPPCNADIDAGLFREAASTTNQPQTQQPWSYAARIDFECSNTQWP